MNGDDLWSSYIVSKPQTQKEPFVCLTFDPIESRTKLSEQWTTAVDRTKVFGLLYRQDREYHEASWMIWTTMVTTASDGVEIGVKTVEWLSVDVVGKLAQKSLCFFVVLFFCDEVGSFC